MLAFVLNFTLDADDDDNCNTVEGQFCVDSGDFVNNTYDWLFAPPEPFGGPVCIDVKKPCDIPPEITNCPTTDFVLQWDEQVGFQFTYDDPDATGGYTWTVTSGPGTVDGNGFYTFNPDCGLVGSHAVQVELCDGAGGCDVCDFTVTVLNTAPVIAGDCGEYFTIGTNTANRVWLSSRLPMPMSVMSSDSIYAVLLRMTAMLLSPSIRTEVLTSSVSVEKVSTKSAFMFSTALVPRIFARSRLSKLANCRSTS
jgi:hypothetical protein